jgi:predicted pyridoxine 5'-phosphate oxidase superfamily flavin-nucleotide-binding protein
MSETGTASDVAFSEAVKTVQRRLGSRAMFERREASKGGWPTTVTADLGAFIAARDSLYLGTASAAGQPYIQHRGGPRGFLKVLDPHRLGFADFAGNRQYVTLGNLSENDRAIIFLMDYAQQRRVKLWGRLAVSEDAGLLARLAPEGYKARPERALVFSVSAWDTNCSQHIVQRVTAEDLAPAIGRLHTRIAELEAEVAALKAKLGET